jgi:ubiquinone/menaquinone biosynthesis C-methylase UbiE
MRQPATDPQQRVIDYYHRWESRWSYGLLLNGARHFGYYPPEAGHVPIAAALALMEDRLGRALGLPHGALVLDAGCGQGHVALRLATHFGFRVEGVDLLARDVRLATAAATRRGVQDRVRFQVMDYADLDFPDDRFDGAYTIEALVHAPDVSAVLAGFHRVLRPGGWLVLFEYSVAPREQLTARQRELFDTIVSETAMHSLPDLVHGRLPTLVRQAGFAMIEVEEITQRVLPMLRWLARVLWVPYQLSRLLGVQRRMLNSLSAVEVQRHPGLWRYNILTAAKPAAPPSG